jgi:hypothetical protein
MIWRYILTLLGSFTAKNILMIYLILHDPEKYFKAGGHIGDRR